MNRQVLDNFPDNAIMPFGIYMKTKDCGGKLHFNIVYRRGDTFFRIEPNIKMKLFYNEKKIKNMFSNYNYRLVYANLDDDKCVENSFKILKAFIFKQFHI